jgi:toxin FitB
MYLVDTNVLSEARRGSLEARTWLRCAAATTIYLSVITLGEMMKVLRSTCAPIRAPPRD